MNVDAELYPPTITFYPSSDRGLHGRDTRKDFLERG